MPNGPDLVVLAAERYAESVRLFKTASDDEQRVADLLTAAKSKSFDAERHMNECHSEFLRHACAG